MINKILDLKNKSECQSTTSSMLLNLTGNEHTLELKESFFFFKKENSSIDDNNFYQIFIFLLIFKLNEQFQYLQ